MWIFLIILRNIYSSLEGPSWSWLYGSWIYNQCLSPLKYWVWILLVAGGEQDTTLCDTVCRQVCGFLWVSSTNKTDHHDITEILLKVALSTIKQTKLILHLRQFNIIYFYSQLTLYISSQLNFIINFVYYKWLCYEFLDTIYFTGKIPTYL
jgi:hypothetical protein